MGTVDNMTTLDAQVPNPAKDRAPKSAPLAPLDVSDDIAYGLFNSFYTSHQEFNSIARTFLNQELILRVEIATRLFWHLHGCVEKQVARNLPLGLTSDEIKDRFYSSARLQVLSHLNGIPTGVAEAFDEIVLTQSNLENRGPMEIALFSASTANETEATMLARIYALAGMVASMRSALEMRI